MIKFIKSRLERSKEKKRIDEEKDKKIQLEIKLKEERIKEERIEKEKKIQLEIKLKEEERIKSDLKSIVEKNIIPMTIMGMNLCTGHKAITKIISRINVEISEEVLYENFIEMYKLTKNAKTLTEIDEILTEEKLITIYKKNIKGIKDIDKKDEYMRYSNSISRNSGLDDLILQQSIHCGVEVIDFVVEQVEKCMKDFTEIKSNQILISWVILMYAKALNKLIIISNYKSKYIQNEELYNITKNLFNEFSEDKAVINKLYPIYKEFYANTFDDTLSINQFGVLANIIKIEEEIVRLDSKKNILGILNEFDIKDKQYIKYSDIHKFIMEIIKSKFDILETKRNTIHLYQDIIFALANKIDVEELLYIYSKIDEVMNDIEKYEEQIKLDKERERYLNNDFTKEKKEDVDKYRFNNIKTGEAFELYLKEIFINLGYKVELTKASGDQGADLVIIKNEIKTVVQAKFYSNTVGNKAVQEVVGAIKFYNADRGMVITNSTFTKSAIELADANSIELVDGKKLEQLRNRMFATN